MKQFPQRTLESDSKALLVVRALQGSHNAGKNYMVTVVTTNSGKCFVSLSGSRRAQAEEELRTKLHWIGKLDISGRKNRPLRRSISRLQERVGDLYEGAHQSATGLHPLRGNLIDPNQNEVLDRVQAKNEMPLIFHANRDCSEPKALHSAAENHAKITGMTTVWYGNSLNPYPDKNGAKNGIKGLNYASPCEFCKCNEARIMMEVDRVLLAKKGVPPKSYEI